MIINNNETIGIRFYFHISHFILIISHLFIYYFIWYNSAAKILNNLISYTKFWARNRSFLALYLFPQNKKLIIDRCIKRIQIRNLKTFCAINTSLKLQRIKCNIVRNYPSDKPSILKWINILKLLNIWNILNNYIRKIAEKIPDGAKT